MNEPLWIDQFVRGAVPMAPQPTGQPPRLRRLEGIRAVLLDIYGTLLISGSGDVGAADPRGRDEAVVEALREQGCDWRGEASGCDALLRETIRQHHQQRRDQGIDDPEVEIRDVWRDVLDKLRQDGAIGPASAEIESLAIAHEVRANPVWPMPEAGQTLARLRAAGLRLGVVSNAQFYTPLLFPALFGASLAELGVAQQHQHYSFEHGWAKPGRWLYQRAAERLAAEGIEPQQAIFVGNDMLNDVAAAAAVGFRTALFAGDARSLRMRTDDPRADAVPDLVITQLGQLADCLVPGD